MATRTIPLTVEEDGYLTEGKGEWVAFFPDYNNEAFGAHRPYYYSVTFNSSKLYANYSGNVTMEWELRFRIGETWYDVYEGSRTMSKSSSNFDTSGYLPDDVIAALKTGTLNEIGVYQDGDREIKGTWDAYGTLTIEYEEIYPSLTKPTITALTQNDNKITITWSHSTYTDGTATRKYNILYKTDAMINNSEPYATFTTNLTSNTYTGTIPSDWYGQGVSFWVIAWADDVPNSQWSATGDTTIQEYGYIWYCYNGTWKQCIPYYGTGGQWKECIPYYGTGGVWKEVT